MEQFLKRISFFLLYLPALVYACQLAYFTGLCEPLNILISSLGMNYTEVMFLGYLNISVDLLGNFTKFILYLEFFIIYVIIASFLYWYAIYPTERENERHRLKGHFYGFMYEVPKIKSYIIKILNSSLGLFFLYFLIFIISLALIFSFFKKGEKEITTGLQQIQEQKFCGYTTGYIIQNEKMVRVKPVLCGNYKCYGIAIDKQEAITYLPEQYVQPLDEFKKDKKAL